MIAIVACSGRGMAADAEYQTHDKPMPNSVLDEQGSLESTLGTEDSPYWLLPRVTELKDLYWDKATLILNHAAIT